MRFNGGRAVSIMYLELESGEPFLLLSRYSPSLLYSFGTTVRVLTQKALLVSPEVLSSCGGDSRRCQASKL
jgi:hypothetical protein